MKQVREAVWIEKELRGLRTPGIAGPEKVRTRGAGPKTALTMQLNRGRNQNYGDDNSGPQLSAGEGGSDRGIRSISQGRPGIQRGFACGK